MSEVLADNGVLVVTMENFDAAIRDDSKVLLFFYAPWDGHCKTAFS